MRGWLFIVVLGGCDKLFGLTHVPDAPPPPDAAIDAPPDAPIDARPNFQGCADQEREGFADPATYPAIAACSGAWSIPGLRPDPVPACNRAAGDDGSNSLGTGCSATDLCAAEWHVCRDRLEVYGRLPAQSCASLGSAPETFFATGQSGPGGGNCDETGTNDVFGCGTYGVAVLSTCVPLDKTAGNECSGVETTGGWNCLSEPEEVFVIYKTDPTSGGGVLCCRDAI